MKFREAWKLLKGEITLLVLLVAAAGFLSAPGFLLRLYAFPVLILTGALASMSAGLFNNLYDRDIDVVMRRTRSRESMISSRERFLYFLGTAMMVASFFISWFLINLITAVFILSGFLSYLFLYTILLKRRTTWNIVIGGIAGGFPALAGWSAVTNSVSVTSLYIAFLVFIWTPTHFWSLASGNKTDYAAAGVPMLPSTKSPEATANYISLNSAILILYTMVPVLLYLAGEGQIINVGMVFYALAIILNVFLLYYTLMQYQTKYSVDVYRKTFHFSNYYLMLLLLGICVVVV